MSEPLMPTDAEASTSGTSGVAPDATTASEPARSPATVVIMNAGSGSGAADAQADEIRSAFAQAGCPVDVLVIGPDDTIAGAAERAVHGGATTVVAAGGDGTVSTVAGVLADTAVALGVIPVGTLNHFAKDVGLPLTVPEAVATICAGHVRAVDVCEVNGTVFVNNSSVGLYSRVVELRAEVGARGPLKWLVAAWATARVLRECPTLGVRIVADGKVRLRRTPLVFVGNNEYQMEGFDAGSRASLTGGTLALYVVRERGALRMLSLVLGVIRGRAHAAGQLELVRVTEAEVQLKADALSVAVDGEVQTMHPPLCYRVRPGALRVITPAA